MVSPGDIDHLIDKIKNKGELPSEAVFLNICDGVKRILVEEPNMLRLRAPIVVVGDIHGQFQDLLELFSIAGEPPCFSYLFLGDYVDRGFNSLECVTMLFLLKLRYPTRFHLLRGNHESRATTSLYGLLREVLDKYNSRAWDKIMGTFDCLSISAIIDDHTFCVHGGLSPSMQGVDQIITSIERFQEVPHEGMMSDLLWSDPDDNETGFTNSPRGAGYVWGANVTDKFLRDNNLERIVRAHQPNPEGYTLLHDGRVITVFSAPNYVGRYENKAAILHIDHSGATQNPERVDGGMSGRKRTRAVFGHNIGRETSGANGVMETTGMQAMRFVQFEENPVRGAKEPKIRRERPPQFWMD